LNNTDRQPVLLGIESSGMTCATGLLQGDNFLDEISATGKYIHAESLGIFIERILQKNHIEFDGIDGIVLSAGPGSFTGLRIGYSISKGLAHSWNIPLIEVPTLDVLAHQQGKNDLKILAVIDAYRKELFYAKYSYSNDQFLRISEYQLNTIDSLQNVVEDKTLVVGVKSDTLRNEITTMFPNTIIFPISNQPSMESLLNLGYHRYKEDKYSDLQGCEPFYMRRFKGVA
jgi:tRNA threonylcarbamoyladenosine biosynthesis protein TsaB